MISGTNVVASYYAWNTSTGTVVTGDKANHTIYLLADGSTTAFTIGTAGANITDQGGGLYTINTSHASTQNNTGTMMNVVGSSTTSNVILIGVPWSNLPASGMPETTKTAGLAFTVTGKIDANVLDIAGSAVNASTAQIGVNLVNIQGTPSAGQPGYAGIDWGHIYANTSVVNLSNTDIDYVASAVNAYSGQDVAANFGAAYGITVTGGDNNVAGTYLPGEIDNSGLPTFCGQGTAFGYLCSYNQGTGKWQILKSSYVWISQTAQTILNGNYTQAGHPNVTVTIINSLPANLNMLNNVPLEDTSPGANSAGLSLILLAWANADPNPPLVTLDDTQPLSAGSTLGTAIGTIVADQVAGLGTQLSTLIPHAFVYDANNLPKVDVEDVRGTASPATAGYIGPDWGHVNAPTSTVGLSATTISIVTTAINLTNAATSGDLTAAMKATVAIATAAAVEGVVPTLGQIIDQTGANGSDGSPIQTINGEVSGGGGGGGGGGLTAQQTRNAMSLASTAGAPAGGSIDADLATVVSRVSTTPIQAIVLVQPGGAIELQQYASYKAERGNALLIPNPGGWLNLTGADIHLLIAAQQAGSPIMPPVINISGGTVEGTDSAPTGVSFDIPSSDTAELINFTKSAYAYCAVAWYSNGDQVQMTDWANCTATPGIQLPN
jgi:hypothetical protein